MYALLDSWCKSRPVTASAVFFRELRLSGQLDMTHCQAQVLCSGKGTDNIFIVFRNNA